MDLNPVHDPLRLRAYLWPDQPHRMELTEAALRAANGVAVDRGHAAEWLAERLAPRPGHLHLVYHTVAFQYFPEEEQARVRELLERAGDAATPDAPLAWLGMEGDDKGPAAALRVRLWPGGELYDLGRVDFHGRWLRWEAG